MTFLRVNVLIRIIDMVIGICENSVATCVEIGNWSLTEPFLFTQ